MLDVASAQELILQHAYALAPRDVPAPASLGLVLAEDVASDIDSPPYDKSVVDGYAVVSAGITPETALTVIEEIVAGAVPRLTVRAGQATRIMTGAPIPPGADAVVMVEHTQPADGRESPGGTGVGGKVRILRPPPSGHNIIRRAAAMRRGDVVIRAGRRLRPGDIGAVCEAGKGCVRVFPRPAVAVLSTGNELVPVETVPDFGQIRNSNSPMLAALTAQAGALPTDLGIARDDAAALRTAIQRGLEHDVLVLSGGVSAGILDLVPAVLQELGVEQVFHKVNVKPGKPIWFGKLSRGRSLREGAPWDSAKGNLEFADTLVFGLPGNPTSSFVCFELFVRPALLRLAGHATCVRPLRAAKLTQPHRQRGDRATYHPAKLEYRTADGDPADAGMGELWVTPLRWEGSADLRVLAIADALACFAPGEREYAAGSEVPVYVLD